MGYITLLMLRGSHLTRFITSQLRNRNVVRGLNKLIGLSLCQVCLKCIQMLKINPKNKYYHMKITLKFISEFESSVSPRILELSSDCSRRQFEDF